MKYDVIINGVRRSVEIMSPVKAGSQTGATIEGRSVVADIRKIAPGTYSVLLGGRSVEVTIEELPGVLLLRVAGREFNVKISDPRAWRRGRVGSSIELTGSQQITAPMPGKIVRVLVTPGQQVETGQGLLVIEAMKMQNEIRSPKSGLIERLAREGQTVIAGEILAVVA